ncbi:MAG: 4-alpha-glucanotransferase [Acidimicrobiales bacterium]
MTDPAAWGLAPGYHDYRGDWHPMAPETEAALLEAMGAATAAGPPAPDGPDGPVWVVAAGQAPSLSGRWRLRTEDGVESDIEGVLPPHLPAGYHELRRHGDDHRTRLVLTPGRCHLPEDLREWGWAVQLYAARSTASWGIGDLADLARLGRWSASLGAGTALVNPLHAALPTGPQQPSPYSPSSRCYRNPLYLRVEEVPGAGEGHFDLHLDLDRLGRAGRALNADRRIDRDAVWALKGEALDLLWSRFGGDPAFDRYCDDEGPALAAYATFCALTEEHGTPWTAWPDGLRHPESPDVLVFVDAHRGRIRFHQWLQWLLDRQLADAGGEIGVVTDLAIGVDPVGADAWLWSDCLALGARVGAPPDEFVTSGQDWGVPPLDPWRLREAAYEPFIRTLRAGFRHAAGLRIDHVMGLFRLFWIPEGFSPAQGGYVGYPWRDLLGILALESARAGAWVVGEDLGTVEPMVRRELATGGVLSYRLVWFEEVPPCRFPAQALAAVTTHDLPTVSGLWTGDDLLEQEELDLAPNLDATMAIRERLGHWAGLADGAAVDDVVVATHRLLAEAPSAVVVATLDDALGVARRPNMPGVPGDRRPNWSLALPLALEEIEDDPIVGAVTEALSAGRVGRPGEGGIVAVPR